MATYLITGCSRGLGLALANHLASLPTSDVGTIFATARSNSPQLQKLIESSPGRVVFVKLDTRSQPDIESAVKHVHGNLGDSGLDVLINNAGVMPSTQGGIQAMEDLNEVFDINVTGVHKVTSAFLPLLRKGRKKKVFNISSAVGSIALASVYPFPTPAYKVSKAALNMLTVQYALEFANEGFVFVPISPGWLQTDMGSTDADLPMEVGAQAVLNVVKNATTDDNGKFHNIHVPGWEQNRGMNQYDGKTLPW